MKIKKATTGRLLKKLNQLEHDRSDSYVIGHMVCELRKRFGVPKGRTNENLQNGRHEVCV